MSDLYISHDSLFSIEERPTRESNSSEFENAVFEDDEERLSKDIWFDFGKNAGKGGGGDGDSESVLCPLDCPLRNPYTPVLDPPLPPPPKSLPFWPEDARWLLYGEIKEWQTRLLALEPGPFGSDLIGELLVVDTVNLSGVVLHEEQRWVEYFALSYTWGSPFFSRAINIHGVVLPITENLFAFLQRFRDQFEALLLWIDFLCINQDDMDEKATQVSNMLAVYERAKAVVVWLGEEGLHTKLAVDYLQWAQRGDLISDLRGPAEIWHARICSNLFATVLEGIEDLCGRDWVRRIWVKQEVWASKAVMVHCGTSRLARNEFA